MERRELNIKFQSENLEEKGNLKVVRVDGKIILKRIFEK